MSLDRFSSEPAVYGFGARTPDRDAAALVGTLADHAETAAAFLKALSHEGRLMILCHLSDGEKSVTELERLIGQRQAAVSQQLARLRLEGLVSTRREGKAIFYSVRDPRVIAVLSCLPKLFETAR
jgi:DNA-binding transcriptional ArsR family regulator